MNAHRAEMEQPEAGSAERNSDRAQDADQTIRGAGRQARARHCGSETEAALAAAKAKAQDLLDQFRRAQNSPTWPRNIRTARPPKTAAT